MLPAAPRFLSFLGIGENVSNMAFIMHTAQDTFVAHVLQAEPNAGPLCKTIEAACKLRCAKCYPNNRCQGLLELKPKQVIREVHENKPIK